MLDTQTPAVVEKSFESNIKSHPRVGIQCFFEGFRGFSSKISLEKAQQPPQGL